MDRAKYDSLYNILLISVIFLFIFLSIGEVVGAMYSSSIHSPIEKVCSEFTKNSYRDRLSCRFSSSNFRFLSRQAVNFYLLVFFARLPTLASSNDNLKTSVCALQVASSNWLGTLHVVHFRSSLRLRGGHSHTSKASQPSHKRQRRNQEISSMGVKGVKCDDGEDEEMAKLLEADDSEGCWGQKAVNEMGDIDPDDLRRGRETMKASSESFDNGEPLGDSEENEGGAVRDAGLLEGYGGTDPLQGEDRRGLMERIQKDWDAAGDDEDVPQAARVDQNTKPKERREFLEGDLDSAAEKELMGDIGLPAMIHARPDDPMVDPDQFLTFQKGWVDDLYRKRGPLGLPFEDRVAILTNIFYGNTTGGENPFHLLKVNGSLAVTEDFVYPADQLDNISVKSESDSLSSGWSIPGEVFPDDIGSRKQPKPLPSACAGLGVDAAAIKINDSAADEEDAVIARGKERLTGKGTGGRAGRFAKRQPPTAAELALARAHARVRLPSPRNLTATAASLAGRSAWVVRVSWIWVDAPAPPPPPRRPPKDGLKLPTDVATSQHPANTSGPCGQGAVKEAGKRAQDPLAPTPAELNSAVVKQLRVQIRLDGMELTPLRALISGNTATPEQNEWNWEAESPEVWVEVPTEGNYTITIRAAAIPMSPFTKVRYGEWSSAVKVKVGGIQTRVEPAAAPSARTSRVTGGDTSDLSGGSFLEVDGGVAEIAPCVEENTSSVLVADFKAQASLDLGSGRLVGDDWIRKFAPKYNFDGATVNASDEAGNSLFGSLPGWDGTQDNAALPRKLVCWLSRAERVSTQIQQNIEKALRDAQHRDIGPSKDFDLPPGSSQAWMEAVAKYRALSPLLSKDELWDAQERWGIVSPLGEPDHMEPALEGGGDVCVLGPSVGAPSWPTDNRLPAALLLQPLSGLGSSKFIAPLGGIANGSESVLKIGSVSNTCAGKVGEPMPELTEAELHEATGDVDCAGITTDGTFAPATAWEGLSSREKQAGEGLDIFCPPCKSGSGPCDVDASTDSYLGSVSDEPTDSGHHLPLADSQPELGQGAARNNATVYFGNGSAPALASLKSDSYLERVLGRKDVSVFSAEASVEASDQMQVEDGGQGTETGIGHDDENLQMLEKDVFKDCKRSGWADQNSSELQGVSKLWISSAGIGVRRRQEASANVDKTSEHSQAESQLPHDAMNAGVSDTSSGRRSAFKPSARREAKRKKKGGESGGRRDNSCHGVGELLPEDQNPASKGGSSSKGRVAWVMPRPWGQAIGSVADAPGHTHNTGPALLGSGRDSASSCVAGSMRGGGGRGGGCTVMAPQISWFENALDKEVEEKMRRAREWKEPDPNSRKGWCKAYVNQGFCPWGRTCRLPHGGRPDKEVLKEAIQLILQEEGFQVNGGAEEGMDWESVIGPREAVSMSLADASSPENATQELVPLDPPEDPTLGCHQDPSRRLRKSIASLRRQERSTRSFSWRQPLTFGRQNVRLLEARMALDFGGWQVPRHRLLRVLREAAPLQSDLAELIDYAKRNPRYSAALLYGAAPPHDRWPLPRSDAATRPVHIRFNPGPRREAETDAEEGCGSGVGRS
mmetsp:Transcript_44248/g.118038  ORF Transcript_44248/g.118038 Transcript_44248/m.118038 type:complete len:1578 (+) Transcript_44248:1772-6505(+)